MLCGLASALLYFGDDVKAKEIMGLISPNRNKSLGYNIVLGQMIMKRTHQYFPITYKEEYNENNLEKYPHIKYFIFFVVLLSEDSSASHSVSIYQSFIFDINNNFTLELNKNNLDWCCSSSDKKSRFVKYDRAVYLYPRSIIYYQRIPSIIHFKDYTKLYE